MYTVRVDWHTILALVLCEGGWLGFLVCEWKGMMGVKSEMSCASQEPQPVAVLTMCVEIRVGTSSI